MQVLRFLQQMLFT